MTSPLHEGRGVGLSPIQKETMREMLALGLPVPMIAARLGMKAVDLYWRLPAEAVNNPNSSLRRAARVSRIKAHIEAMPGIPMTIASEAIE
jgi:hypothetical protein